MTCPAVTYRVGNAVLGTCTVMQAGVLFDPAAVFAFSHSPNGQITSLSVVRVSIGVYTAQFVPKAPGPWVLRFSDNAVVPSQSNLVADQTFIVMPLAY